MSAAEDSIDKFLKHLETVYPATSGTQIKFTGEYLDLPQDLNKELISRFPDLNIRIAKMTYLHWGMEPVNLMVFQDSESGNVVTFLWDIWFTDAPFSFESVVGSRIRFSTNSKQAFISISQLIAFSMGGTVEPVKESEGKYTATIIDRRDRPWRVLTYFDGSIKETNPTKNAEPVGPDQPPTRADFE